MVSVMRANNMKRGIDIEEAIYDGIDVGAYRFCKSLFDLVQFLWNFAPVRWLRQFISWAIRKIANKMD